MNDLLNTTFLTPIEEFFKQVGSFLPHLLAMLLILAFGFAATWVIKLIVYRSLKVMRFDQFSGRIGFTQALKKGGMKETPSHLVGRMVYWVILLAFFMLGLNALNLNLADQLVGKVFSYLPHILVALLVLLVGLALSNFFGQAVLIALVNAGVTQARLLAGFVRVAVMMFAVAMAFEQLGIATTMIVTAFAISFGGLVLALAIAFGLGAKDAAKELIDKRLKKESEAKEEEFSHL